MLRFDKDHLPVSRIAQVNTAEQANALIEQGYNLIGMETYKLSSTKPMTFVKYEGVTASNYTQVVTSEEIVTLYVLATFVG